MIAKRDILSKSHWVRSIFFGIQIPGPKSLFPCAEPNTIVSSMAEYGDVWIKCGKLY